MKRWAVFLGLLCLLPVGWDSVASETPQPKENRSPLPVIPELPPFPNPRYEVQPLSLSQVLMKTLGASPSIIISKRQVSVRYAQRITAIETFFPSIAIGGGTMVYSGEVQRSTGQFANITKQSSQLSHGLFLSVNPLSSSFQTLVANTNLDSARSFLSETENQKMAQGASLYFRTSGAYSKIAVYREAVQISRKILDEERRLVELGGASVVGILRAAHEVARNTRFMVQEENRAYRLSFRLAQLLGESPPILPTPRETFLFPRLYLDDQENLRHLLALADRKRPLLAGVRQQVEARRQVFQNVLFGPAFPTLSAGILNGSLGPDFTSLVGMNQTITMAFWNIGPGGLLDPGGILLARKNVRLQEARLSRQRFIVHRQVSDSFESLRKTRQEEEVALEDVRLAKLTFDATQIRVQLGLFHALELIISLRDLINAQLRYIDIVEEFEASQFRLMAAIGVRPDFIAVNSYPGVSGLSGPVQPKSRTGKQGGGGSTKASPGP